MDLLELATVRRQIEKEFPLFVIVAKRDSLFMRAIGVFLLIITFGKMRAFMDSFTTTVGWTIYTPNNWGTYSPRAQCVILRHERVHLRQQRKHTRVVFGLLYLLVFFPLGLAYFRAKFEKEAYAESLRANREYGMDITGASLKASIVNHFISAEYGWMWPFRGHVEHWYDETVKNVLATTTPQGGAREQSNSGSA